MNEGPDIHGMVNDQQFQSLPPRDQRRALYQLTNDQSFQGLSDADTMRFVGSMRATSTAATTTPPALKPPAEQSFLQRMGLVPTQEQQQAAFASPGYQPPTSSGQPGEQLLSGLGEAAKVIGKGYAQEGPMTAGSGIMDILRGNVKQGASKVIEGSMTTALPLAPEAIAANPLMALRAGLGGYAGSKAAQAGTAALGGDEESQRLASNIGALAGGGLATRGKIPSTGDLAAKGKALTKLAAQELASKTRLVRRPSVFDLLDAVRAKEDPQMALFKSVPKLGDFPAAETPVNPPAEVAKTAPSVAPTKTDSGLPQRSNLPKNLRQLANTPKTYNINPSQFLEKIGGAKNMNPESVAQAKSAWAKGEPVEPPTMTIDEQGNVLEADGRHRALGAVQAGIKSIPIRVIVKRAK